MMVTLEQQLHEAVSQCHGSELGWVVGSLVQESTVEMDCSASFRKASSDVLLPLFSVFPLWTVHERRQFH